MATDLHFNQKGNDTIWNLESMERSEEFQNE